MRIYYVLFITFLCTFFHAKAQNNHSQSLYVGLNPSRTLFHIFGGYSIDPEVKYQYKKVLFSAIVGFSNYKSFGRKNITDYSVKGAYYKVGIAYRFDESISLTLNYLQGFANEQGKFHLKNSFGDYFLPFERTQLRSKGLELTSDNWISMGSNFYVIFSPRITYATAPAINTYNKPPLDVKLRYMTGIGANVLATNDGKAWLTFGFECKLLYNIWSRPIKNKSATQL